MSGLDRTPSQAEASTAPHPEWPSWDCALAPLSQNEEAKPWTVGDKYKLSCQGSSIEVLQDGIRFVFPEADEKKAAPQYILHPLEVLKVDANSLELVVTGYRPGSYNPPWVEITDGSSGFRTENLSWQVQSVIPEGEQAQPVMNVSALQVAYPLWLWGALILAVLVPSLLVFLKLRRKAQIKRLVEQLASSSSALRPFDQFSKEVRSLVRQYDYHRGGADKAREFVVKLNESFKSYLTRAFKLPALVWSPSVFSKEVRKRNGKTFKELSKDLRHALVELNRTESSKTVSADDADQLKKMTMVVAEKAYKTQEEKAKR